MSRHVIRVMHNAARQTKTRRSVSRWNYCSVKAATLISNSQSSSSLVDIDSDVGVDVNVASISCTHPSSTVTTQILIGARAHLRLPQFRIIIP